MTAVAQVMVPRRTVALDVRAIKIVVQRDLIRTYQDRTRFVSQLIQPFLFLFVLGSGLSTLTSGSTGPIDLRTFMFPGVLATSIQPPSPASGLLRMTRGQYVKARIMIPLKFGARLALGVAGGLTGRTR